jgi:hypothetical protein
MLKNKIKEIKKNLKKNEKIKTGKHTNHIKMEFVYEKNNPMPVGINMCNDCTMADKILGLTRLIDVVAIEAAREGKSVSAFIAACMKAYIDKCESEED